MQRSSNENPVHELFWGFLIALILMMVSCSGSGTPTIDQSQAEQRSRTSPGQVVDLPASVPQLTAGEYLRFENISTEDGLSQSTITAILQDSQGFMWFGTEGGLNKYDGRQFTIYQHDKDNPLTLSDNVISSLFEDQDGSLWIGTSRGLDRLDRRTGIFIHYPQVLTDSDNLSSTWVSVIYQDHSGTLWIGTEGEGLIAQELRTDQYTVYTHNPDDPRTLSDNTIHAIYEDQEEVLWIGTDQGLDRFDPLSGTFVHDPPDPSGLHTLRDVPVYAINEDNQGALWIGTQMGLYQWNRARDQFTEYRHDPNSLDSISDDSIRCIFRDSQSALWIGTRNGLDQFDQIQKRFLHYMHNPNDPQSLVSNSIRSVYEDRSGVIWIGTAGGGLSKYSRAIQKFPLYKYNPGFSNNLSDDNIWSIYEDHSNVLWIGTFSEGLNKLDRYSGVVTVYQNNPGDSSSLSNNDIRAILEDRNGNLWIGTEYGGLNRFNPHTEIFFHYQHDDSDPGSLSSDRVFAIYEDHLGRLWIGTQEGGLNLLDQDTETFTSYRHDENDPFSLSNNDIRAIYEDHTGILWIGTLGGVNLFDEQTNRFTNYQHDPGNPLSLSSDFVASIFKDSEGTIWIGTFGGGLNRFDRVAQSFTHFTEKDGLPDNTVYGILEGSDGTLWLSTNKGLSNFDPRRESFRNYSISDGLQGNQFNPGAFFQSRNGELFFGGTQGFNAFFPEQVTDNPIPPPVVITAFEIFNQPIQTDLPANETIQLSYRDSYISFEFAALDYNAPEKNQYAYKLDGVDKDWVIAGTRHYASFTNLPGGEYVFRVKGSNNDGVWNETGAVVQITIVPPFWETWWFRGLVSFTLIGTAFGAYRLRVRNLEVRSRELERQVQQRTHELESLYLADEELYRHLELDRVLQALVNVAVDILHADKSSLMVWDKPRKNLVARVAHGFSQETLSKMSFAPGEGAVGQVALSGDPVIVEDAQADPHVATWIIETEGIRSFIHLPIKIKNQVFGVFNIAYLQPRVFNEEKVRLFKSLAQRAAVAIENAQLYEQAQEIAAVEERQRLARDLHDAVTQTLFSTSLIAEVLPEMWAANPKKGKDLLDEIRQLSQGALAEMRTLLLQLRPAALAEAELGDLLQQLATGLFGRMGLLVYVAIRGDWDSPDEVKIAIYRIAQEALNNIVKHADANKVSINLNCNISGGADLLDVIELIIQDDGCGFDPLDMPPDHLGLGIMQERAASINASLDVESHLDEGTKVKLVWQKNSQ